MMTNTSNFIKQDPHTNLRHCFVGYVILVCLYQLHDLLFHFQCMQFFPSADSLVRQSRQYQNHVDCTKKQFSTVHDTLLIRIAWAVLQNLHTWHSWTYHSLRHFYTILNLKKTEKLVRIRTCSTLDPWMSLSNSFQRNPMLVHCPINIELIQCSFIQD